MTNREWLFQMSDEDLAIELVKEEIFNEYGDARYTTTDEKMYWSLENAISEEIEWLKKERNR